VKFTTFVGFCFGVGSIPLFILLNLSELQTDGWEGLVRVPFILIGTPIAGAINGALAGIVGYPVYRWLAGRVGLRCTGTLYSGHEGDRT
jgi:hypothetical protein